MAASRRSNDLVATAADLADRYLPNLPDTVANVASWTGHSPQEVAALRRNLRPLGSFSNVVNAGAAENARRFQQQGGVGATAASRTKPVSLLNAAYRPENIVPAMAGAGARLVKNVVRGTPGALQHAGQYLANSSLPQIGADVLGTGEHLVKRAAGAIREDPYGLGLNAAMYTALPMTTLTDDYSRQRAGAKQIDDPMYNDVPGIAEARQNVDALAGLTALPIAGTAAHRFLGLRDSLLAANSPLLREGGGPGDVWGGAMRPELPSPPAPSGGGALGTTYRAPLRLHGPAQPLALPPPGEALPDFAVKRRGGQWMPPEIAKTFPYGKAPEDIARDDFTVGRFSDPARQPAVDALTRWRDRNLTNYLKTDFGTPEDPLRSVYADRPPPGLPEENYDAMAHDAFLRSPNHYTFGELVGPDTKRSPREVENMLSVAPWMAKQPVTDPIYSLNRAAGRRLALGDLSASMRRAVYEPDSLPPSLAVNPASLPRLSVADAFQRHHDIEAWDEAQAAAERKASMTDNPALALHKAYPGDPKGMAWHEIVPPDKRALLKQGYDVRREQGVQGDPVHVVYDPKGHRISENHWDEDEGWDAAASHVLDKELGSEGDIMGNCVGGYCDPVMRGDTRIFSLRDKEGNPHVNIETAHNQGWNGEPTHYIEQIKGSGKKEPSQMLRLSSNEFGGSQDDWLLPYVHDFIHGGIDQSGETPWTGVQDMQNTGLERMHGQMVPLGTRDAAIRDALDVYHQSPVGQLHARVRAAEGDDLVSNLIGPTGPSETTASLERNPHYLEARQFLNRPMGNSGQLPDDLNAMWRTRPTALPSIFGSPELMQPYEVDEALKLMDHWRDNPMQVPGHINFAAGGRVSNLACKCQGGHV